MHVDEQIEGPYQCETSWSSTTLPLPALLSSTYDDVRAAMQRYGHGDGTFQKIGLDKQTSSDQCC